MDEIGAHSTSKAQNKTIKIRIKNRVSILIFSY